jgi:hypothetical protein
MVYNPTIKTGARPWGEAKLKVGAIASVAQPTGTPSRATYVTSSVTLATLAGYVMALAQDLKTRGIIQ